MPDVRHDAHDAQLTGILVPDSKHVTDRISVEVPLRCGGVGYDRLAVKAILVLEEAAGEGGERSLPRGIPIALRAADPRSRHRYLS